MVISFFGRAVQVLGALQRLIPALAFGTPAFFPLEYSILLEALPAERSAKRFVLTNNIDFTPTGLFNCLRRHEQTVLSQAPSAFIWFSSLPTVHASQPSKSSSTPASSKGKGKKKDGEKEKPKDKLCVFCGVVHEWGKHPKCINCGGSPHDRSSYPAASTICACGKTGHFPTMCLKKLKAAQQAANIRCATMSLATPAVSSGQMIDNPHFGKDDGATVDAVGELYLRSEAVQSKIKYSETILDPPIAVKTAHESSDKGEAIVYASRIITIKNIIFVSRLETVSFLVLPQSSVPFLFFKSLAQRLEASMNYATNLMTLPSSDGTSEIHLPWTDLRRYYGLPLEQLEIYSNTTETESLPDLVESDSDTDMSDDDADRRLWRDPPTVFMSQTDGLPPPPPPGDGIKGENVRSATPAPPPSASFDFYEEEAEMIDAAATEMSTTSSLFQYEWKLTFKQTKRCITFTSAELYRLVNLMHCDSLWDSQSLVFFSLVAGTWGHVFIWTVSFWASRTLGTLTMQLSVVEDCHNFGLTCRYHGHPKSHEVVTFLETVWVPRFGILQEIRCDQGSEFAGALLIEFCEKHGIHLTFSPSGYKDGNSIVERWHRDVLASVRSILLERGLSPFQWPTVVNEAVRCLNNHMSVRGALSRHDEVSLPPALPCLRQFLSADRPPPPSSLHTYSVGEIVMYNVGASGSGDRSEQEHKCGPVWYPYHVVRAENAHFYEIEATDPSFIPQNTTASPHQLHPAAVPPPAEMTSTTMPSPTPSSSSVAGVIDSSASVPVLSSFSSCSGAENPFSPSLSPLSVPSGPIEPGTMIVACPGRLQASESAFVTSESGHRTSISPSPASSRSSPPSDHPDHGQYLWVLQKAVYGLPDAGRVFEDFFASKLTELGWTTGLFPGVWFLRDKDGDLRGIVVTYVDDLLILGIGEDTASLVDPLKDFITCGDYTELTEGRFVGVQFEVTTDGVFTHQTDYISSLSLPPEHIGSSFKPADKPLPVGSMHEDDVSPPLDSRGASLFRTLLGQVGYVANYTRPDVALAYSYLSRFMAAPTERAFQLLLQTLRYLRTNPSLGIHIHTSDSPDELTGVVHGDASFGNAASPHPQSAWILFINGFPLMHKSRRQPRVARSTTRAEFLALEDALDAAIYFAACMQPFYKSTRIGIGCDAANVFSLLLSGAPSSAERALLPLVKELKPPPTLPMTIALVFSRFPLR
uniref:Integrase catalytic domain-containing protein n=1 Tax=Chromera velia CCMP2878 TaxID=1169474 RepID=A0A0G4GJ65_9ALVE|eukprot:Cvel_22129.t1-p1 / transcript=Cvel_22129.t1 / gene=Cvel_22129 / organism=Chromera_velia_CCMP2878 / gene_product=Putative transposon Ty5-1 protein YCL074W, putative / transcript_product=Putative transposon Ty5-1 protein YCL074W, putative / location=Cvel_scaffold2145:13120-17613(+) / protein_length=1207 / sequence_SO=supercontig / SO=protein_coding / is_pseudo=false